MRVLSFILIALFLSSSLCCSHDDAEAPSKHRGLHRGHGHKKKLPSTCDAKRPSPKDMIITGKAVQEWKKSRKDTRALRTTQYTIRVTFHILRADPNTGDVSDALLAQYMNILNNEFSTTPFSFVHVGTNRVDNPSWHACDNNNYWDFTAALHVGGKNDANIYFCSIQTGSGGWAYYPYGGTAGSYWDGIVAESNYVKYGFPSTFVRRTILPHEFG